MLGMLKWTRSSTAVAIASALAITACSARSESSEAPQPVSVGYGEIDRSLISGAVSSIQPTKYQQYTNMEDLFARIPGVHVVRRGPGDFSLRIRGFTSLSGGTDPLLVIDGIAVSQWGTSGALASLNPKDVARVDVLKDGGAAAIYGVRGANGVVLITTKRR